MKNRSAIAVVLLSFITLGIYTLFWLRDTRKELIDAGQKLPPVKLLLLPFLLLPTVALLQFISRFVINTSSSSSDLMTATNSATALLNIASLLVGMLAILVILPLTFYWFYKYCKAAEGASQGQISFAISFILFVALSIFSLSFIWPGIMQSEFNKLKLTPPDGLPPANPFPPTNPLPPQAY